MLQCSHLRESKPRAVRHRRREGQHLPHLDTQKLYYLLIRISSGRYGGMRSEVISGGTGHGMAGEFPRHGHRVVVYGRGLGGVEKAVEALGARHGMDRVFGLPCAVGEFLNVVADRVETVAPYLVERILANDRHGERIDWLTMRKLAWRLAISPFDGRDPFVLKESQGRSA